jgi:hypothetical protein
MVAWIHRYRSPGCGGRLYSALAESVSQFSKSCPKVHSCKVCPSILVVPIFTNSWSFPFSFILLIALQLHCGFHLHFLLINYAQYLFNCLLVTWHLFVCFLWSVCQNPLHICLLGWLLYFVKCIYFKYILPVCVFSFHTLNIAF